MIPTIGIMIGLYIILRYVEMCNNPNNGKVIRIFAGLFILITIFLIFGLFISWAVTPTIPSLRY